MQCTFWLPLVHISINFNNSFWCSQDVHGIGCFCPIACAFSFYKSALLIPSKCKERVVRPCHRRVGVEAARIREEYIYFSLHLIFRNSIPYLILRHSLFLSFCFTCNFCVCFHLLKSRVNSMKQKISHGQKRNKHVFFFITPLKASRVWFIIKRQTIKRTFPF